MTAPAEYASPVGGRDRLALRLYLITAVVVFLLMMVVGVLMRMAQAAWLSLAPQWFYEFMTLHGAGMVGTSGLASAAVMWYFLRRYVPLSTGIFLTMFWLSVAGVVLILGAILLGHYAAAWTFLYPLPATSSGVWGPTAAALFLTGYLLIGVGFLLFNLDAGIAITRRYGSLLRGLGVPQLVSGVIDSEHPPTVVASSMVIIVNTIGTLAGAVVLVMSLVNLLVPAMQFDALLSKNLIFFFGHVFINATIYMAVIAVYELLPMYTGRPWKVSRPFIGAWVAATLMVLAVYPHHLLMDFAMPRFAMVLGQVLSYASGIPVLCVTAYTTLVNVNRSGIRWDSISRFVALSVFGWAAGIVPAIIDGTLTVNRVMHNTQWVPGHFHFYLILGLLPMLVAFMMFVERGGRDEGATSVETAAFWSYAVGGLAFAAVFLYAGSKSVPRRWAVHLPEWIGYDRLGAVAAVVVLVSALYFGGRLLGRVGRAELAR